MPYLEDDNNARHLEMYIKGEREQTGYPAYALPVVTRGPFKLSQTPAICKYLGRRYGLYPKGEEDQWHADAVNLTVHDLFGEISRDDFKEKFVRDRVPKFLKYFESLLAENEDGKSR